MLALSIINLFIELKVRKRNLLCLKSGTKNYIFRNYKFSIGKKNSEKLIFEIQTKDLSSKYR